MLRHFVHVFVQKLTISGVYSIYFSLFLHFVTLETGIAQTHVGDGHSICQQHQSRNMMRHFLIFPWENYMQVALAAFEN